VTRGARARAHTHIIHKAVLHDSRGAQAQQKALLIRRHKVGIRIALYIFQEVEGCGRQELSHEIPVLLDKGLQCRVSVQRCTAFKGALWWGHHGVAHQDGIRQFFVLKAHVEFFCQQGKSMHPQAHRIFKGRT